MRYSEANGGRFGAGCCEEAGIELDDAVQARLKTAGHLLRDVRRKARLSQFGLAARARINERTVRRIERGEAALLNSYWSLAYAQGLPPDWFVRPEELLAARGDGDTAERLAAESLDSLARTGWFGPEAMAYLREYIAFGRDDPGLSGAADAFASGQRLTLRRSRDLAARRAERLR